MKIGIDGSRAFIKKRTGVEEYSYQVIKNLRDKLSDTQARFASTSGLRESRRVVLYVKHNQEIDFDLPDNWKIKKLWAPRYWTQIRLSLEMIFNPVDSLFVPAHTVPFIHPKNTIVTIHGLEYEIFPKAYSLWERFYMRWSIRNSCKWASRIVTVSDNTKKDLIRLYGVKEDNIKVIYEGYVQVPATGGSQSVNEIQKPYLLFIGRLEARKNIKGIIRAFDILKEKYRIPHKLVLAGGKGYGYEEIKRYLQNTKLTNRGPTSLGCGGRERSDLFNADIILTGYISEEKKWILLKNAEVFLFPTLYEGFGIPVLEAQSVGTPVVAGNNSSIPEITNSKLPKVEPSEIERLDVRKNGYSALLVDSNSAGEIAEAIYKLISDESLKNDIIRKGLENVKRFSWDKCAIEIFELLIKNEKA